MGDLVDRVGSRQEAGHQGVSSLVVGGGFPVFLADNLRFSLQAHEHLVLGVFEVEHVDFFLVALGCQQGSLVDQVLQVRAGKTGRALGQDQGIDVRCDGRFFHVDPQDLFSTADVGQRDHHLPVEAARAQQGRIEDIGAVGGRYEDHPFVGLEPVHLHQQLVEGLFPLVMAAAEARTPVASHRVDLVDEDDARGILLPGQRGPGPGKHRHRQTFRRNPTR